MDILNTYTISVGADFKIPELIPNEAFLIERKKNKKNGGAIYEVSYTYDESKLTDEDRGYRRT